MKLKKIGSLFLALFFFSLVAIGLTTNQAVKADDDDEDYHASSEQLINKFFNERELLKNGARAEILGLGMNIHLLFTMINIMILIICLTVLIQLQMKCM